MRTVHLEFDAANSREAIASRLTAAGLVALPGYEPVPMRGAGTTPDTVVVAITVPPEYSTERLRAIPGVLRVLGDLRVAPF